MVDDWSRKFFVVVKDHTLQLNSWVGFCVVYEIQFGWKYIFGMRINGIRRASEASVMVPSNPSANRQSIKVYERLLSNTSDYNKAECNILILGNKIMSVSDKALLYQKLLNSILKFVMKNWASYIKQWP